MSTFAPWYNGLIEPLPCERPPDAFEEKCLDQGGVVTGDDIKALGLLIVELSGRSNVYYPMETSAPPSSGNASGGLPNDTLELRPGGWAGAQQLMSTESRYCVVKQLVLLFLSDVEFVDERLRHRRWPGFGWPVGLAEEPGSEEECGDRLCQLFSSTST